MHSAGAFPIHLNADRYKNKSLVILDISHKQEALVHTFTPPVLYTQAEEIVMFTASKLAN